MATDSLRRSITWPVPFIFLALSARSRDMEQLLGMRMRPGLAAREG